MLTPPIAHPVSPQLLHEPRPLHLKPGVLRVRALYAAGAGGADMQGCVALTQSTSRT